LSSLKAAGGGVGKRQLCVPGTQIAVGIAASTFGHIGMEKGIEMEPRAAEVDYIDLYEQLLYQRASMGIRPVLYISSQTDLECSMLMLLDDDVEAFYTCGPLQNRRVAGYHVMTN
jgi:hypothetical protein